MIRKKAFVKKLREESASWRNQGIITADQQSRILAMYSSETRADIKRRLPAVVIGLAVILLCAGLMLFYAANWKKMPPPLKLVQVFGLILLNYGLSYYFLAIRKTEELLGRAFLMMGMVSFGAGIVLTAQIFHISAHPSNGVLLWTMGVLAMSWVVREKWGYLLALLLSLVWHFWEVGVYDNPNYIYVAFPLLFFYLFHDCRFAYGFLAAVMTLVVWLFQVNIYWVDVADRYHNDYELIFLLLGLPLGSLMLGFSVLMQDKPFFKPSSIFLRLTGLLLMFFMLMTFSWPWYEFDKSFSLLQMSIPGIEFFIYIAATAILVYHFKRQQIRHLVLIVGIILSVAFFIFPIHHKAVLMTLSHLGLLGLVFGLLYHAYGSDETQSLERWIANGFALLFLLSKCIGFFSMGVHSNQFYIAYCLGFIILGAASLFLNQTVGLFVSRYNREYPGHVLNSVICFLGFWMLYALSFKIKNQTSIFRAETEILVLIILFIAIAVLLFLFLASRSSQKRLVIPAGVILFASVAALFLACPSIHWIIYSLIFNSLLFLFIGVLLYHSLQIQSSRLLNLAVSGFLIHVGTRYIDIFWDMLSGSLLFIVTGILTMIGGYYLEKNRRKLLEHMKKKDA